ncbi:MAG: DUF1549 domain-containing protein, partial [Verrucomicrobiales bacterium]|nr:DUF1549 domain-containing protein [Verrucomicrobiales bacterium]
MRRICQKFRIALSLIFLIQICPAEELYKEPELTEEDRGHWAFLPLQENYNFDSIDACLLAELNKAGIEDYSPRADDHTLLRRLYLTLHGLPPGDDLVEEFRYTDFEEAIEKLLASPHYGERWAQHWLDVARFAETDGFEHDKVRPGAWRYRDWVIDALNRDMPYNKFAACQIAGDELYPESDAQLGTGLLFAGPDMPDI